MILEYLHSVPGIMLDRGTELFRQVSAFAGQAIGDMGGIRVVELLLIAGFVMGLVACMYEIKTIKR